MSVNPGQTIVPPSQRELEASLARFQADWGVVDDVLYRLCRDFPNHDFLGPVTAKVALTGRAYAAGLERQVTVPGGQQAIVKIANFVLENSGQVDEILAPLAAIAEPLDPSTMVVVVEQHGCLTALLQKLTRGGTAPRSFASKYLHFHSPVVPIFDDYARSAMNRIVSWDQAHLPFALPAHGDEEYWKYCVRFLRLYDACRFAGVTATVKSLDAYLWAVPVSGKTSTGITAT